MKAAFVFILAAHLTLGACAHHSYDRDDASAGERAEKTVYVGPRQNIPKKTGE